MELRILTPELLPAFLPYLSDEAVQAIREKQEGLLALGAVTDDFHSCGAACAAADPEGLVLFSLFVDPQIRRQGVASLLLNRLEEQAPIVDACSFVPQEDLAGLTAFLNVRGFRLDCEESPVMQLRCSDMRQSPRCRRAFLPNFRPDSNVVPFSQLTDGELEELLRDDSIPAYLRPDHFEQEVLTSPLSFAYRYKGAPAAYFLAVPVADGAAVKAAVSRSMAHGAAFLQLASAAIHASLPGLTPTSSYWLEAVNESSLTMAKYLCSDGFRLWYDCYAYREEN